MAIRIQRRSRDPEDIPLASTADIAFLLIIFFLAASALLELRGVKLPLPKKDAPPMQIESRNLMKIRILENQTFMHENRIYELPEILSKMKDEAKKNPELVFSIRVDPDCPVDIIPRLLYGMQKENLIRFSLTIDKQ